MPPTYPAKLLERLFYFHQRGGVSDRLATGRLEPQNEP